MKRASALTVLAVCIGFGACSPIQLFPSEVMDGVDPNFDFSRWRTLPNQALERKIQLGGSIFNPNKKEGLSPWS
jgi:hypothetical protein